MATLETSEVVIEATPEEIMDVIADVEALTEWSSAHQSSEVLERYENGRPKRTKAKVKTAGITDEQVLEYTWYDDGVSWTLISAKQQRSQDARYTLTPEGDKTRVRFEIKIDPAGAAARLRAQACHERRDEHRDRGAAQPSCQRQEEPLIGPS